MSDAIPPERFGSGTSLLVVDLISDFEFEDGDRLFERAKPVIKRLSRLKRALKSRNVPVIYVNDQLSETGGTLSKDLVSLKARSDKAAHVLSVLPPQSDDHWIIKPQRSGFFATGLANLLMSLEVSSLAVAGVTTDMCVFFTAHDAHMRGYSVWVPADCSAALEDSHHEEALKFLSRVAEADTTPACRVFDEIAEPFSMGGFDSNDSFECGFQSSPAVLS